MALSESRELDFAMRVLIAIKRRNPHEAADLAGVISLLSRLKKQAQTGVHRNPCRGHRRNPQLVVYNPPDLRVRRVASGKVVGQIASNVHEIRYEHAEDGEFYKHEFNPGVKMFAINGQAHEVLLTGDKPLWKDF